MGKVKSSYYLPEDIDHEMRVEAAKLGMRYPSEFIALLFMFWKVTLNRVSPEAFESFCTETKNMMRGVRPGDTI